MNSSYINPTYGFLNSQALDSPAFAAKMLDGQFGQFEIGAQTYHELCDYPPAIVAKKEEVEIKIEAIPERETQKRPLQPSQPTSLRRGRENQDPSTPTKRIKTEEAVVSVAQSSTTAPLYTKWQFSVQAQLRELHERIETLEEENLCYRAQAEGRLDGKLQVKFYPLVQRMGELEERVNYVNDKMRMLVIDTSDDEEDEEPEENGERNIDRGRDAVIIQ
ncbi:hypothetical protein C8R44DRAFT_883397 [Mycena epipterygia]|nr:hypothetical protein C8R44DRAFT_883397 [Mycena epipterygia]